MCTVMQCNVMHALYAHNAIILYNNYACVHMHAISYPYTVVVHAGSVQYIYNVLIIDIITGLYLCKCIGWLGDCWLEMFHYSTQWRDCAGSTPSRLLQWRRERAGGHNTWHELQYTTTVVHIPVNRDERMHSLSACTSHASWAMDSHCRCAISYRHLVPDTPHNSHTLNHIYTQTQCTCGNS